MQIAASVAAGLMALLHVYIMLLEMLFWDSPRGLKAFGLDQEFATRTKVLAANQGLYNGFLAAGLIWGVLLGPAGNSIKAFFLGCIVVAGIYGSITSNKKILFVQGVPGAVALTLVLLAGV